MNSIIKEILREYEKDQISATNLLKARKSEIYEKIPRIRQIDDNLNAYFINFTKNILLKKSFTQTQDQIDSKISKLLEEKKLLLQNHNYDSNYFEQIFRCQMCSDTGFVKNEKCYCFKQKLIEKYYDMSNLKQILQLENFDTFDISYYSNQINKYSPISPRDNIKTIYQNCLNFVINFDTYNDNLLFYGNSGLGKTFLCNCIAKDLLEKGKTVIYITAPQIFKLIENQRFHKDEQSNIDEYLDMIYKVDLLIIDDLGSEISTIVTSSELFNIINSRILTKKLCLISTNLDENELVSQYSERLVSRFFGNFKMMHFIGEDIRVYKKYKNSKINL